MSKRILTLATMLAVSLLSGAATAKHIVITDSHQTVYPASATEICGKLPYYSEQDRCLRQVRGKDFDPRGLNICQKFSFSSQKINCLATIADRRFTDPAYMKICARRPFDSQRLSCLKAAPYQAFVTVKPEPRPSWAMVEAEVRKLKREVQAAKRHLRKGPADKTDKILAEIIARLQQLEEQKLVAVAD